MVAVVIGNMKFLAAWRTVRTSVDLPKRLVELVYDNGDLESSGKGHERVVACNIDVILDNGSAIDFP